MSARLACPLILAVAAITRAQTPGMDTTMTYMGDSAGPGATGTVVPTIVTPAAQASMSGRAAAQMAGPNPSASPYPAPAQPPLCTVPAVIQEVAPLNPPSTE
jgi:hypothetical protein